MMQVRPPSWVSENNLGLELKTTGHTHTQSIASGAGRSSGKTRDCERGI